MSGSLAASSLAARGHAAAKPAARRPERLGQQSGGADGVAADREARVRGQLLVMNDTAKSRRPEPTIAVPLRSIGPLALIKVI